MRAPYSRTMFELLDEQSARYGTAVICGGETVSYRELTDRARQAATLLRLHGVRRGDRVGMVVNNRIEWLEIAFGAWLLGAVPTPFSTWSTKAELKFLLQPAGCDQRGRGAGRGGDVQRVRVERDRRQLLHHAP